MQNNAKMALDRGLAERSVPFNQPVILSNFSKLLEESLATQHLSGMGPFTQRCEEALNTLNRAENLIVNSATAALEMMGLLCDIKPGDEVIMPSFTFVSTANAFALRGAQIRFADNDEFGNIKIGEIERLRSSQTKLVVAVHYAGCSADMEQLEEVCKHYRLILVEDAAQAIGSLYKNIPLGTIGDLACYSFHETKNISCGEGGALIVNNRDKFLAQAQIIREKGTNRRRFIQGLTDKYTWVGIGSSYVLSDLNSAILYPQIQMLEEINLRRNQLWRSYHEALAERFQQIGGRILSHPKYNTPNYHLFAIIFPTYQLRTNFIAHMQECGIYTPFHYVPLHNSPFGARYYQGGAPEILPACQYFSECLVRLPLYYNMDSATQTYVIDQILAWLRSL